MPLIVAFVCAKQSAAHSIPSTSILRTFIDFKYSSLSDSDAADGSVAMHVARIPHSTSPVGRFRPFTINTSNKPDYSESSPIGDPCQRFPPPFHATAHDCPTHSSVDDCNFLLLRVFLLHRPRLGVSGMTDTSVFEEFVRRYQDMVYGKAVRLLGDPVEAEDISQTVFMRAFERFDMLRASPSAGGWLRTVTTNLCLNHLSRFRARWRLFSQNRPDAQGDVRTYEESLVSPGTQCEDLERVEEYARLERGIRRLPPHQRVPLVLFHFEQHSYRDIAGLLGISLAKVKTDIHRGREALRSLMVADDEPS